jgi:hypothetical protein
VLLVGPLDDGGDEIGAIWRATRASVSSWISLSQRQMDRIGAMLWLQVARRPSTSRRVKSTSHSALSAVMTTLPVESLKLAQQATLETPVALNGKRSGDASRAWAVLH